MSLINDALKRARQAQKAPALLPGVEGILAAPSPLQPVDYADREKSRRLLVILPVLLLSLGASFWFFWKWKSTDTKLAAATPSELTESQPNPVAEPNVLAKAATTVAQWEARQQSEDFQSSAEADATTANESKGTVARPADAPPIADAVQRSNVSAPKSKQAGAPERSIADVPNSTPRKNAPVNAPATPPASKPALPIETEAPAIAPAAALAQHSPPQAVTPSQPASLPKLQGIFYRLRRPTALINGRIVSPGDEINGYRVGRIERDLVRLTAGGRTTIVRLN
jgi:hypothetical protein